MSIKIEHKVLHKEWDEASLTPVQFIKFNELYCEKGGNELYPTFVFDNGKIYVDESYDIASDGRVSTSSYANGVMSFSESKAQYIESYHSHKTELGQLLSVQFTIEDRMRDTINLLNQTK